MAPFRITHPNLLANFLVEGGLIFGVLTVLATATVLIEPGVAQSVPSHQVGLASLVFAGSIQVRRKMVADTAPGLTREFLLTSLISAFIGICAFSICWAVFRSPGHLTGVLMLEAAFAVPVSIAGWRWLNARLNVLDLTRERILIVGTGRTALEAARAITVSHGSEFVVVGFADEDRSRMGQVLSMGVRVITDFSSMAETLHGRLDRIVVALDEKRGKLPIKPLMNLRLRGFEIEDSVSFFERVGGKIAVDSLLPSWLIFSDGFKTSRARAFLKRAVDLFHATMLLVISSPVMLLAAIAIPLESRGGILYRQKRVGLHGREFEVLKFRSMVADAESRSGPTWASKNDPRVTRIGRFMRKTRIDELPQLFNVLRGDMSFVGPRPERRVFVEELEEKIPYYGLRHTVRPGITGWAQVQYGYGANLEENKEKLKYDLFYIKNGSVWLDLWIALKTVRVVLGGVGAR